MKTNANLISKFNLSFHLPWIIVMLLILTGCGDTPARQENNVRLLQAVDNGDKLGVQTALTNGADVNTEDSQGLSPLLLAAKKGRFEIAELLLRRGAEIEKKDTVSGVTALWMAAQQGYAEIARLLLDHGADVESKKPGDGPSALWIAVKNGHAEVVKLLLESGARSDAGIRNKNSKYTPLNVAQKMGYSNIVTILKQTSPTR